MVYICSKYVVYMASKHHQRKFNSTPQPDFLDESNPHQRNRSSLSLKTTDSLLVNLQHKNREELPVKCKKSNVIEEPKEEQIEFSVPPPTMS